MKEAAENITYEIEFKVMEVDGKWTVTQLSNDDLEKLLGVYGEE